MESLVSAVSVVMVKKVDVTGHGLVGEVEGADLMHDRVIELSVPYLRIYDRLPQLLPRLC